MANKSRNLGIFLLGDLPPNQIAETAQLVEQAGFSELWVIEDYFMLSAFAMAGITL
jgi:alkanesulfonate monooxygenase SsuD/methylene tetrahydromethanopterin reductase-like flavin-dependent oxidoreductase (luciferase family)